jgi:SAM-dependent methyltransferase
MKILDLGCGKNKIKGSIGLDIVKADGVDIVWDLTKFPYPFKDNEFDIVNASHILEHIEYNKDFFKLMKEVHRILKPKGKFIIKVPYWKGMYVCSNPEHRRFFNHRTFDYFEKDKNQNMGLSNFSGVNFKVNERRFNIIIRGRLDFLNVLNSLFNLNHNLTEMFLSNILAPEELYFELEVLK